MKQVLQSLNGIALFLTVCINYLSNTGLFNGETMGTISAKYQNLFTPAGYAFSIWGLIYIGLLGFVIYFGPFTKQTEHKTKVVLNIGWWFLISCCTNSLWVVAWLYEYTFITVLLMLLLLASLLKIIQQTEVLPSTFQNNIFLKLPFQIYSGWISVALIANVAAYLKKISWNGFGIPETNWTIVLFMIALALHLFMIWKRRMPVFAMVAVWALIAIAIANKQVSNFIFFYAIIVAGIILLNSITAFIYQSKNRSI